ncbi:cation transport protein-domain-containing protein [Pyronema domesticum]|nr:cation transport protein-domain-containing protein [Pyronema domesticum]
MDRNGVGERLSRPYHFNFITLHYMYLIGMTLVGSLIVWAGQNMPYIDALFFASGACTQSGLNTIDVNTIKIYQQVVIWFLPFVTTPIFINTVVVYIRLYWFEKRFKNIVSLSRQPSKARTMSQGAKRDTSSALEQGVGGRNIRVLHRDPAVTESSALENNDSGLISPLTGTAPSSIRGVELEKMSESEKSSSTMTEPIASSATSPPPTRGSNLQFELPTPRDNAANAAGAQSNTHIAFLENQKAPNRGKALRIPGPREFEQGGRATEVDDDDTYTLHPARTADEQVAGPFRSHSFAQAATNASSFVRRRTTLANILPPVASVLSNAMSPGTAIYRKSSIRNMLPRKPTLETQNAPYLSYQPTIARNSQFVDLTDEQRDELGGIEYRSLKLLGKILLGYYILFHLFGVIGFIGWIYKADPKHMNYLNSLGVSPAWWAIFTAETTLNDVGFTVTPDSMISFQKDVWVLLLGTFLIIIGNTGFPCMLRFIIWVMFKLSPKNSRIREPLNFLLDHPRRCFTLLFPPRETWILFWVLVFLNGADVILFIVLDLKDPDVQHIEVGYRIVAALFQAASTRTAGTSVISIAAVHPAVQVSYMIMMYISVFPIAISVRKTNVYEEKSLGLYGGEEEVDDGTSSSYVGIHFRKQLSFDMWYIFLGLFIITIAEGGHIENTTEYTFTTFSCLFEVISAYGTVGLSLGYPNFNPSFSGRFSVIGKLVIIAMQIRGRHRGLPYELDRAVLLPKEQHDTEHISIRRRSSNISQSRSSVAATGSAPLMPDFAQGLTSRRVPSQAIEDE